MARALTALFVAALGFAAAARAQEPSPAPPLPPPFPASFGPDSLLPRWRPHPAFRPGGRYGVATPPALVGAAWEVALRAAVARREAARWGEALRAALAAGPGATPGFRPLAPPLALPTEGARPAAPPRPFGAYADLGLRLNVRLELSLDRFRNLACTPFEAQFTGSGCRGGVGTPRIDQQFNVQSGGVVGDRLHVNVDFDSQREFDANNDLRVWYEGLPDEILRRVEVGNVTFQTPPSRFVSSGIPANNFGVQATAQFGALEVRGIFAQQQGNVVRDRSYTIGAVASQPLDREARDLDFEVGRFFFVVDPAALPGFPAVDILNLDPTTLPPALRVGQLRIYRLRALSARSTSNQNIGGIRAIALSVDSVQRVGPFPWEFLIEGRDYYADPNGAWIALANRLDENDFLAVSYVTADGRDTVGTFPAAAREDTATERLRLVYEPKPTAGARAATFRFEMRNVYRVGSSDVVRESAELALVVNERERSVASNQPYLALLGLGLQSDPAKFDQYNRLFPRQRDPNGGAPIRDYYVVFPHLTPFADSTRLTPAERNDSLYRTPRDLLRTQGPASLFALRLHYEASGAGDRRNLSLGAFQIREGSERIYLGQRLLQRGVDYTVDYDIGQVTFADPDALFATTTQVRAQFEERAAFDASPTAIFGLVTRYDLGGHGALHFLGLLQRQQTAFTRPPLGFEPSSSFIGAVSADLRFEPNGLTRFLDRLPLLETETPSSLTINGEVAFSKPNPNQAGQAYLEEFEGEAGIRVPLAENVWQFGSVPASPHGVEAFGVDPITGFDSLGVAALTWQNIVLGSQGLPFEFTAQQIDTAIVLVGAARQPEQVLWIALKPDTIGGLGDAQTGLSNWTVAHRAGVRWRSLTQSLSPTGLDLSRTEFLEFWVWENGARTAKNNGAVLVFDFGTVFEDALVLAPDSFTVSGGDTTYYGERPVGIGRLDTERDSLTSAFNAVVNDLGILGDRPDSLYNAGSGAFVRQPALCSARLGGTVQAFFFADLRARCTRRNGAVDTEDLDGDNRLDIQVRGAGHREGFVRYVFPIGDPRYYVRDGGMQPDPSGTSGWRLYRIPFRTDTLLVGDANLRQVQSLRITVLAPAESAGTVAPQVFFGLARARLIGAPWVKRAATPIAGLSGARGQPHGEVVASVVSTENRDLGYTSPPGVFNEADRRGASLQFEAQQVNERSLRVLASDLRLGERAEIYTRFATEGDKNFLRYRRLRVWARGRGAGWEAGDLQFFVKVGKDEDNFYLYRTGARTTTWEPEVVIDLERWLRLRAQVEAAWLSGAPPSGAAQCGGDSLAFVACDGPYLVHLKSPGIAPPNLARVQEMAVGIHRVAVTTLADPAELWVDDIRLSDAVNDVGTAAALDVHLTAADFADVTLGMSRRDDQFRQLGEDPSYVTDALASVAATVRLERLLPAEWGLAMPLTARYARTSGDPFYLNRSDLRADALGGRGTPLRTPENTAQVYSVSLRRVRRSQHPWLHYLVDPVGLALSGTKADATTQLTQSSFASLAASGDYALAPEPRTVRVVPGFLLAVVDKLPGFLRRTDLVQGLRTARLRWNPAQFRFASAYNRGRGERFDYRAPVRIPQADTLPPTRSEARAWRNDLGMEFRPFASSALRVDLSSTRDLVDYGDSTTVGRLARQARQRFLGRDVGFERLRTVGVTASASPLLLTWLKPRFALGTSFAATRDPNTALPARAVGDTGGAFRLPYAVGNSQRAEIGAVFEPRQLARGLFGDSGAVTRVLARMTPLTVTYSRNRRSNFDRMSAAAPLGYQIPLGGLVSFLGLGGGLPTSASSTSNWNGSTGFSLIAGFRASATFVETKTTSWVLRGSQLAVLTQYTREWPSGTIGWSFTPPAGVNRYLVNISTQALFRRRVGQSTQLADPTGGRGSSTAQTSTTFSPSATITWFRGILTSVDLSRDRSDNVLAGNRYRSEQKSRAAGINFGFRPPVGVVRLPSDIRVQARVVGTTATSCLQQAGAERCVTFSDTRRTQTQVTLETGFPPSFSAGLQFSRLLSEERQVSRKFSQTVFTAFITLTLGVGQLP